MAFVSLQYLKQFMRVTNTADDDNNQIYLDMAFGSVIEYLGIDVAQTTYPAAADGGRGDAGYYCGNGRKKLVLRQRPITAVSAVYLDTTGRFDQNPDGAFASSTLLVAGTDYLIPWDGCLPGTSTKCCRAGIIERIGTVWPGTYAWTPGRLTAQTLPAQGNIKIAYTAGWPASSIPTPIRGAICQIAASIRRNAKIGGNINSESQGAYSYSLFGPIANQWPEIGSIRGMLSTFKDIAA
jgi:hypothetical protein